MEETLFRGTTICAVKRNGKIVVAGDGQVTMQNSIIFKSNAKKVRRIYNNSVVIGFAGSVADAFSLSEKMTFVQLVRAEITLLRLPKRSSKTLIWKQKKLLTRR